MDARVGRAVALMAASILGIAMAAVLFLHPNLLPSGVAVTEAQRVPFHASAIDFVSPYTGWVVVDFATGDYALLRTTDGGLSWSRQLSGPAQGSPHYLKFFDVAGGVTALVGTRPVLYRTSDGGRTWTSIPALSNRSTALSWSFVDSDHGWLLADPQTGSPPRLYRTEDRGWTWKDLGPPAGAADEAFGARFSFLTTGWLATAGSGAYAYKTDDFGDTWQRVSLPAPRGAEGGGRYFVDVQQTSGLGAIASVVYFPPYLGRTGSSGRVRQFPPLDVPFYDGSRPNNYIFPTLIDQVVGAPFSAVQRPFAELLSSVDDGATWVPIEAPALTGTLGYADASRWWWIDAGAWAGSADGGVTWSRSTRTGGIEPLPGSLDVLDRDHAWFAGMSTAALETTSDGGKHWRLVSLAMP
jgi:photosystem II stability/assembly factor-like uncharacterized protein